MPGELMGSGTDLGLAHHHKLQEATLLDMAGARSTQQQGHRYHIALTAMGAADRALMMVMPAPAMMAIAAPSTANWSFPHPQTSVANATTVVCLSENGGGCVPSRQLLLHSTFLVWPSLLRQSPAGDAAPFPETKRSQVAQKSTPPRRTAQEIQSLPPALRCAMPRRQTGARAQRTRHAGEGGDGLVWPPSASPSPNGRRALGSLALPETQRGDVESEQHAKVVLSHSK